MLSSSTSTGPDGEQAHPAYQVCLPVFQGPIELLLSLIEEQRLEVTAVSLAAVADQYLEHIGGRPDLDPEEIAGFVEVAARLLLIKSRALLPAPAAAADEEDVAGNLIERLQEYRRFRLASRALGEHLAAGLASYAREPSRPELPLAEATLKPVAPHRLAEAVARVLLRRNGAGSESGDDYVSPVAWTITGKLKLILRQLLGRPAVLFSELIGSARCHGEVVVTFLAVLELVRRGRVRAIQTELFSPISITRQRLADQPAEAPSVEPLEQVC